MGISAAAAAAAAGEAVGRRSQSGSRAGVISAVWLLICLPGHKLGASPYRCGGEGSCRHVFVLAERRPPSVDSRDDEPPKGEAVGVRPSDAHRS